MINSLNAAQRTFLRGLAHGVRPAVQVGVRGLEPTVLQTIDQALTARELVKVQLAGDRGVRRELSEQIAAALAAELVWNIGRMAVFFRRHPDPSHRRVSLPTHGAPETAEGN